MHIRKEALSMAKPIKETPVLDKKDSKRFSAIIRKNEKTKAPAEEVERVMSNYNKLKDKFQV